MREIVVGGLGCATAVRIVDGSSTLAPVVERAWRRCLARTTELPRSETVAFSLDGDALTAEDGDIRAVAKQLDVGLQTLTQQVTRAKIRFQAGRMLMLHAGAVCHPTTREAIAFVAPGGTGKTTLTTLLSSAYSYLTDETVGVDRNGQVFPYPKPLSLRRLDESAKSEMSPDDLGLLATPASARLRRIVLIARSDKRDRPTIEPLSTHDALLALSPEISSLALLPNALHWVAGLLADMDQTLRLTYCEADSVADLVGDWLRP